MLFQQLFSPIGQRLLRQPPPGITHRPGCDLYYPTARGWKRPWVMEHDAQRIRVRAMAEEVIMMFNASIARRKKRLAQKGRS